MPCLNYLSRDAIRELYQEIHNFSALLVYHDSYLNDSYLPLVPDTNGIILFQFRTGYSASSKFYLSRKSVKMNLSVYKNLIVPDTNDSFTVYTFLMNKMNKIAGGEY